LVRHEKIHQKLCRSMPWVSDEGKGNSQGQSADFCYTERSCAVCTSVHGYYWSTFWPWWISFLSVFDWLSYVISVRISVKVTYSQSCMSVLDWCIFTGWCTIEMGRSSAKFGRRRSSAEFFGEMFGSVRLGNMWLFGRSSANIRHHLWLRICGFWRSPLR